MHSNRTGDKKGINGAGYYPAFVISLEYIKLSIIQGAEPAKSSIISRHFIYILGI